MKSGEKFPAFRHYETAKLQICRFWYSYLPKKLYTGIAKRCIKSGCFRPMYKNFGILDGILRYPVYVYLSLFKHKE